MRNPRFSLPEIIIVLIIVGTIDFIDFMITIASIVIMVTGSAFAFITFGVSAATATAIAWTLEGIAKPLLNLVSTACIQFYLFMKGVRKLHFLGGALAELIPILNTLPMRTVSMIVLIAATNKGAVQEEEVKQKESATVQESNIEEGTAFAIR